MFTERKSIRLQGYDYAQEGMYFVTICTKEMGCVFGDVQDGEMLLNDSSRIADNCWKDIPNRFAVRMDEYIIMPNHVHGIICMGACVGGMNPARTLIDDRRAARKNPIGQIMGTGALGEIIRWFKGRTTYELHHAVRAAFMPPTHTSSTWQRNYYERIIRNDDELQRIREYIRANPKNWTIDEHRT